MAILTLVCPACGKSALIDDEDENSFCMHCGVRFEDLAIESAIRIEPVVEQALRLYGAVGNAPYEPADYSGEPWYPQVQDVETLLIEGDAEGAADKLAGILDANQDASADIERCMHDVIAGWLVDCITEGDAYSGGLADICRLIEEYGEDSGPNVLIASLFYAIAQTPELVRVPEDSAIISETLFNLLLDYPEVEPDIRMQLEMCTDFMHASGLLIDLGKEVTGAVFSLDFSMGALAFAKERGANLLVTHHPAIYRGVKTLNDRSAGGRLPSSRMLTQVRLSE